MNIEILKEEVERREEENLPYLHTKVLSHETIKDKYRAITAVNEDGSLFSGNSLILKGQYSGVYTNPQPENTYHRLSRFDK